MFLVIIIPCFNEEQTIAKVIVSIPSNIIGITKKLIVVVDDGSTDNTAKKAEEAGAIVVSHKKNTGVGEAFKTGITKALRLGADVVVNMDGDGQFNPLDIEKLIQPIINHTADFTTASRFFDKSYYPIMPKVKFIGNKLMASLISGLVRQKFYDVSCGFRAYSNETLLKINLFGQFTYTQESFIDLAFKGLKMQEIPIHVRGQREYGKSRVASNLFKYAFQTSKIILRTFRDYKPFKLFGGIGVFFFVLSTLFGGFLMTHYIKTGQFTPHKWSGFVATIFLGLSVLSFVVGFILDMFSRMRSNQEEILYYLKKSTNKDV